MGLWYGDRHCIGMIRLWSSHGCYAVLLLLLLLHFALSIALLRMATHVLLRIFILTYTTLVPAAAEAERVSHEQIGDLKAHLETVTPPSQGPFPHLTLRLTLILTLTLLTPYPFSYLPLLLSSNLS